MNCMGRKLTPEQKALYKRIDEIIFYDWDPIGISNTDWPRDEYETYVPRIFGAVIKNDDPEPIAILLGVLEYDIMGLSPAESRNLTTAKQMLSAKAELLGE